MPKGFSKAEKAVLREKLLEQARHCLATYGIKKTSIEDLTSAVGISTGAFYLFFESKEVLFFEVLQQFETAYHTEMLRLAKQSATSDQHRIQAFLQHAVTIWRTHPLFTHFSEADYLHLQRKLPPATLKAENHKDQVFIEQLLSTWRTTGVQIMCDSEIFFGLLRSLFVLSLQAGQGQAISLDVLHYLIDMFATHITES